MTYIERRLPPVLGHHTGLAPQWERLHGRRGFDIVSAVRKAPRRQLLLAVLTGALYPFCFPNFDLGALAWVVLLPLHLTFDSITPRRAFWLGWLAGTVGFTGCMFWVITAMHTFGKLPLPLSVVALGLLAGYLGLYVAGYALAVTWIRRWTQTLAFLSAPFLWVALELIRTYLFSGLPWALLGYTQYRWLTAIQIADLTGVYGVSFLLVLVNAAAADVILWRIRRSRERYTRQAFSPVPWPSVTLAVLGAAVALLYGHNQLRAETSSTARSLRIGLVQANIDQAHKWDEAYLRETLRRYRTLTARVAEGTDLIVWPEAATPFIFEQQREYRAEITSLIHRTGTPLLFGSPALRYFADGRPYLLNSAYLLSSDGELLGRYDKRHLVPFGEYVPLRSILFFLDKLVEGIGDFEAGTVPAVLALPPKADHATEAVQSATPARFGVVICFEVIFPNLVREFVRDGAEFMVTITNDAWFGDSAAPYQHFGMVVLRAVENHVAFARAANTGISGFIDRYGRILNATPIFTEAAVEGRIAIRNAPTFYSHYGDVFAYGCVIISGIFLLAARFRASGGEPHALVVGAPS